MRTFPALAVAVLLASVVPAQAGTITFSEPAVQSLLTNTCFCLHTLHYSDPLSTFNLDGVTFTAGGPGSSGPANFVLRTTFDDRSPSPYSYDFISENVMQVSSTELNLMFAAPTTTLSFGVALDATASPGSMSVQLFGNGGLDLGTFSLLLQRTVLSASGGTNSNSEGEFIAPLVGPITAARLINGGSAGNSQSQVNWVIDNVVTTPVPEGGTLLLIGLGLCLTVLKLRRP